MAEAFTHPIHVRYLEVDQQGVVFNMWYLAYFDDAMTAYLEHIGFAYDAMLEAGVDAQIVHTSIDWRGGVGFGDPVRIAVTSRKLGTSSFTLGFEVLRDADPVVSAEIVYVCIASDGTGKRPIPDPLRKALDPAKTGHD